MARLSRREFLRLSAAGMGALVYAACKASPPVPLATRAAPASHSTPSPTLPVESNPAPIGQAELPEGFGAGRLTPLEEFYVQSYDVAPSAVLDNWALDVTGLVEKPLRITWDDLVAFPAQKQMQTLECIGNPVGGRLIANTTWRGTLFKAILDEAVLKSDAAHIIFSCEDEYTTTVSLAQVTHERCLLAYEMDGKPLIETHGFPVRALIPGVYGQKQPKWVVGLHVVEHYSQGTWEKDGWSDEALIRLNARIETPQNHQFIPADQPFFVTGVAMADLSGVRRVEVSADGGASWQEADLLSGPTESVWTLWAWKWDNPQPGQYQVVARVTDGRGRAQSKVGGFLSGVFPDGTSDMHAVSVMVVD